MMNFIFWQFVGLMCSCWVGFTTPAEQTEIRVTVTGVSKQKGEILAALFLGESGFPGDASKAFRTAKASAQNGQAQLLFEKVPAGTYAIALFHDANGDGVLNTNMMGIPKEGYGFSNNAKNLFSGPSYKQAAFKHQHQTHISITVRY